MPRKIAIIGLTPEHEILNLGHRRQRASLGLATLVSTLILGAHLVIPADECVFQLDFTCQPPKDQR
jgi:hypothetical protein